MKKLSVLVLCALALTAAPVLAAGPHPGSDSDCFGCHEFGKGNANDNVPRVTPKRPGWFARLFGAKDLRGHPSVSCAGEVRPDGTISGCHRPEAKGKSLLVMDLSKRPADEFCGVCHADQRKLGSHHPTYKSDKNKDGVADTIVRPVASQDIFASYLPSAKPGILQKYPDALFFYEKQDGTRVQEVSLPLQTVVELVEGQEVQETNVATCITCHNPHYGYLVDGVPDNLEPDKVARKTGDALLRLRDHNNALCVACH